MTSRSNSAIPQKIVKIWGRDFPTAFDFVHQKLNALGFVGPLTWKHGTLLPFYLDVSKSIRVILSLSKCGGIGDTGLFDGVAVVMSKTIHERTISDDPWGPLGDGDEKWHEGYVACLVYRLAHLKWAEKESTINPAWAMTLSRNGTSELDATAWLHDFESLLLPVVLRLKTDADLTQAMLDAINYKRPDWVKSDGPGFGRLRELVGALNRVAPNSN